MNATAPAGALRIGVLGPLEVRARDEDRTPTAPMARRALALLLLNANRLVSTSSLIEELWEADPPRLARKTVQTYVYQMRKALRCPADPHERVRTAPGGYRIDLRPGELDLWEFDHAVVRARTALSEGDPRTAATLLREALALWRGEPFAGLETGPMLTAQIAQIAEARLSALELRITADLQLGRHRGLVGELLQVTADHPLNEEFTAHLMLATHRSGQRATALEAFTRLRRRLVDELGIEPSERLQKLQRDVLSESLPQPAAPPAMQPGAPSPPPPGTPSTPPGDAPAHTSPVTQSPPPVSPFPPPYRPAPQGPAAGTVTPAGTRPRAAITTSRQLPLDIPDFTGRVAEMARLAALAGPAAADPAGSPRHHGAPASTASAASADATAPSDPTGTASGAGPDAGPGTGPRVLVILGPAGVGKTALAVHGAHQLAPYFPDGTLYTRLHDAQDRPRGAAAALGTLLRGLGLDTAGLPEDTDELSGMFRAASSGRSLLVMLDDAASTDQVLPLLPADGHSLALVTSRVRLPGLPGARSLSLGPLSPADAAAFFTRLAGAERLAADRDLLERVTGLMGNFPLTLRTVGEKFAARPMWTLPDLARGLTNDGHLAAELHDEACDVLARASGAVARLPQSLHRALSVLASAGPDTFDITTARRLLGGDTWSTQSVLGQLLDHHVILTAHQSAQQSTGTPDAGTPEYRVPELIRLVFPSPDDAQLHVLPTPSTNPRLHPHTVAGVLTATG
ncbi:BTAD domain-containing putative transcriptional regulator [Streptomyces sp. NPDC004065]|uniref:AfsR/SARP family transcriptional regulator n=1 Tax=Streptomyces sp. NPDC004065 TaxID=3364689 RepID=UPI0038503247